MTRFFIRRIHEIGDVKTIHHDKQNVQSIVPTFQHDLVVFHGLPCVHGP